MIEMKTMRLGPFRTNCYLVWEASREDCVVIDPGDDAQTVLLAARNLGKQIQAILLTHGHFDHVGAVREIAEHTQCRVYLCLEDLRVPVHMTAGPLYYTHSYQEGDRVAEAGLEFAVMHTPGHTPGCVCLFLENNIFSGDTLFAGTCGRTDLEGSSWTQIQDSLHRLAKLEGDYMVYPGHGGMTTLSREKQWNPYMQ